MTSRTAIIIGAGPAGLTAALELLERTAIRPIVLEKSTYMGGLARTVQYRGNRIDIGGHRFFSKSDRVMNWWLRHVPLADADLSATITYHGEKRTAAAHREETNDRDPGRQGQAGKSDEDLVMLVRKRKSRIYFLGQFFTYPIQLTGDTIRKLGIRRTARISISYLRSALLPVRPVVNLEQFFINRFGRELYLTFFKGYTEKVWGTRCDRISASWGEQRIKGLSIRVALKHMMRRLIRRKTKDVRQKNTETTLIEQFLYPKLGPGQMWEEVARNITAHGGRIVTQFDVTALHLRDGRVSAVSGTDASGQKLVFQGDLFFSTMPIRELVRSLDCDLPANVREVSEGLCYRDFITVGLLLKKLEARDSDDLKRAPIADNWIYIQEPGVLAGRVQIYNNWSPGMVADPDTTWLGVEYFCQEGDDLWRRSDSDMAELAARELAGIGLLQQEHVLDYTIIRMPKSYPKYLGTYERLDEVRDYIDGIGNLFLIGRNGMHKYNNQDHSMLTAMVAVDNVVEGRSDKSNVWAVNTEHVYQEQAGAGDCRPSGA